MICYWATNRSDPQNLLSITLDVPLQRYCKRTALFPPQNCIMMFQSDLSLFKYY